MPTTAVSPTISTILNHLDDDHDDHDHDHHDHNELNNHCNLDTGIGITWILIILTVALLSTQLPLLLKSKLNDKTTAWINSIGAGLLLGTCFFHLLPEILEGFLENTENDTMVNIKHCMLSIVSGFLFILVAEQFVMTYVIKENDLPIHCHPDGEIHLTHVTTKDSKCHASTVTSPSDDNGDCPAIPNKEEGDGDNEQTKLNQIKETCKGLDDPINIHHCHESVHHHSRIRALVLVFSISIHAFFEGFALTMQAESWKMSWPLGVSLIPHKIAVGMTMAFQILSSRLDIFTAQLSLLFWACITPIGGSLALITCKLSMASSTWIPYVNAFAVGTFLSFYFLKLRRTNF